MGNSPKLGLHLIPEATTGNFLDWRLKENGENDDSNMMILDAAVGDMRDWKDNLIITSESQPENQPINGIWYKVLS